jgi:DNA-binding transcriptional LysR family regulator
MFDWNDLKYFLAVARAGSTLSAAKSLKVNQSTVHRRLQELEKRLGCALAKRHPAGYRLTELGEQLLARATAVEDSIAEFERAVSATSKEAKGTVRLTCPEALGPRLIGAGLIQQFNDHYPEVRVEFVMSDRILDLGSEADIAIRAERPTDKALFGRKIADSPWALYASRSYIERCGNVKTPDDLDGHSVVIFSGALYDHRAVQWLRSVAPRAHVAARSSSLPALLLSVKSGAGLAPLPVIVGENESTLVRVLDLQTQLATPFYLLMHQDMRSTPRVRVLFDFVIEHLAEIRPLLTLSEPLSSHRKA